MPPESAAVNMHYNAMHTQYKCVGQMLQWLLKLVARIYKSKADLAFSISNFYITESVYAGCPIQILYASCFILHNFRTKDEVCSGP